MPGQVLCPHCWAPLPHPIGRRCPDCGKSLAEGGPPPLPGRSRSRPRRDEDEDDEPPTRQRVREADPRVAVLAVLLVGGIVVVLGAAGVGVYLLARPAGPAADAPAT